MPLMAGASRTGRARQRSATGEAAIWFLRARPQASSVMPARMKPVSGFCARTEVMAVMVAMVGSNAASSIQAVPRLDGRRSMFSISKGS